MLYMIELRFTKHDRDSALDYFWKHGTNNYEGKVSIKSLWVSSRDRIAYALIVGHDSEEVDKACTPLESYGDVTIRPVVSSDDL